MSAAGKKPRVGEALVHKGALSPEQLQRALDQQKLTGMMLGEILVEEGIVSAGTLITALSECLGTLGCVLRHGLMDPGLLKLVGEEEAERLVARPLLRGRNTLTVGMPEPQSLPKIDHLRQLTGCKIRPVLGLAGNIRE